MEKTVIITGASGNLGGSVVKKFLEDGYQVIGIVHKKTQQAGAIPENYEELVLDLRNEAACEAAVSSLVSKRGRIDVAVFTAGGFAMGTIEKTKASDIYQQYQLNFETAYHMARPVFLQMMTQNKGRIFFIGSRAGNDFAHARGVTAYALSKSLLFRLAELMNVEAKGKNVVASVVVPSTIDTPQNRKDMPNADYSHWASPSEIAAVIQYYASPQADIIREPVIKVYKHA